MEKREVNDTEMCVVDFKCDDRVWRVDCLANVSSKLRLSTKKHSPFSCCYERIRMELSFMFSWISSIFFPRLMSSFSFVSLTLFISLSIPWFITINRINYWFMILFYSEQCRRQRNFPIASTTHATQTQKDNWNLDLSASPICNLFFGVSGFTSKLFRLDDCNFP